MVFLNLRVDKSVMTETQAMIMDAITNVNYQVLHGAVLASLDKNQIVHIFALSLTLKFHNKLYNT